MTDLEAIARDLYALPQADFTAARNARAKSLKADGEKDLARAVGALRKPSTAAWVVNTMVRQMPDRIAQLLDLGAELREAQAGLDGAQLRALAAGRRQLVAAVAKEGRSLARGSGHPVSEAVGEQVAGTLQAAMADPAAEAAVLSGMLVEPLIVLGMAPVDLTGAVAVEGATGQRVPGAKRTAPLAAVPDPAPSEPDTAALLAEAEREARARGKEVERAAHALAKADKRTQKLQAQMLRVRSQVEELRRQAFELEHELEQVQRRLGTAEEERAEAEVAHVRATEEAEQAGAEVERLRAGS